MRRAPVLAHATSASYRGLGPQALGDFLTVVTLTLRVEDQTNSGFAVAGLLFAASLPLLAMTAFAGWVVDRFETKPVLAVTAAVQGLCVLALAAFDSLPATYALVFALNAGGAIERPALFAVIPRIVGEDRAPIGLRDVRVAEVRDGDAGLPARRRADRRVRRVDHAADRRQHLRLNIVAALALRTRRPPATDTRDLWPSARPIPSAR